MLLNNWIVDVVPVHHLPCRSSLSGRVRRTHSHNVRGSKNRGYSHLQIRQRLDRFTVSIGGYTTSSSVLQLIIQVWKLCEDRTLNLNPRQ